MKNRAVSKTKQPSDKLFRLIKTMTKSEKRYFLVWSKGQHNGEPKYLQLFRTIDRTKNYDEQKILEIIYHGEKVNGKKFSELKAYLFDQILRSLQDFDENSSIDLQLNHHLQCVNVLFLRGLWNDCSEILKKARRQAEYYEKFSALLEILSLEKQLAYVKNDVDYLAEETQRIDYEENMYLNKLNNLIAYRRLFLQIWMSAKTEAAARQTEKLEKLKHLNDDILLRDIDLAVSHRARILFFRTKTIYHYLTLQHQKFYETGRTLLALLESKKWFLKENLTDYIAALSNFWLACGLLKKYDEVAVTLEKLRKLQPISSDDRIKIRRQYFSGIFNLCVFTGNFEQGKNEMAHLEAEMEPNDRSFFETTSFQFMYFSICFGSGDFGRALDFINKILSGPRSVERQDLQSLARVLNLIVHFEMGNFELVESLLRSSARYLKSKNRDFELEKNIMHLMAKLVHANSKNAQKRVFLKEKEAIFAQMTSPVGKIFNQYFDLESWFESKISTKSFAEIVREKVPKKSKI